MTKEEHIARAEDAFKRAEIAWKNNDYPLAAELAEHAVELMPDERPYLNLVAAIAEKLGKYDKAINHYEQALNIDFYAPVKHRYTIIADIFYLGTLWESKGEHEKASDCKKVALKMDFDYCKENHYPALEKYDVQVDNMDYNPRVAFEERNKPKKKTKGPKPQ